MSVANTSQHLQTLRAAGLVEVRRDGLYIYYRLSDERVFRMWQAIRDLSLPVRVLGNPDGADLVLTLKNYYRRKPESLRQAESSGVPIHILKSNSVTQVKEALTRIYGAERHDSATSRALSEALDAIRRVKSTLRSEELSPQNAYVRRLQHQLVADNELVARSTGKEPQRRLRIMPAADLD